jgi:tetratricopeptide (TPR) repeat protein
MLIVAVLLRFWLMGPAIPRPDLSAADPEVIQAIDAAETAIRRAPSSAEAWGELGLLLLAQSYATEAEACFQKAGQLDSANWRWPYFKAVSLESRQPEKASDILSEAIARDASIEWPQLMRAELLAALGRLPEAEQQFRVVLAIHPELARAELGLARVLLAQERLTLALAAMKSAKSHASTRKAAWELVAQINLRKGDLLAAQEATATARDLPRDAPWPGEPRIRELAARRVGKHSLTQRIGELSKTGALRDAAAITEELERRHPEVYLFVEGRNRLEGGDPAGAERALRAALDVEPNAIETKFYLGKSLADQQQFQAAEQTYRDLLADEPSYGPAWLELGRCLRRQSPESALPASRQAVQYLPRSIEAHAELASLLNQLERPDEARLHADIATKLQAAQTK